MNFFQSKNPLPPLHRALQEPTANPAVTTLETDTGGNNNNTTTNNNTPNRGRTDLINLVDFDVQVALTDNLGIEQFELTDIVTAWMADSFQAQLAALGYAGPYADFDTVVLLDRAENADRSPVSELTEEGAVGLLYTQEYKGAALFNRQDFQLPVPNEVVESIQRTTLINDVGLLQALQVSGAVGLGSTVIDVRAAVNIQDPEDVGDGDNDDTLDIVIIIAIIVAAVAFIFLVFAIFWAYRYEKMNRDAYLVNNGGSNNKNNTTGVSSGTGRGDKTGSNTSFGDDKSPSPQDVSPMEEVDVGTQNEVSVATFAGGGSRYPESVISEDISSSLSQYYRSGMAGSRYGQGAGNHLNDAASISSMESYGYSLDGYAPSLATPQPSDLTAQKHKSVGLAQREVDDSEDEVTLDHEL